MTKLQIHQFAANLSFGDAISNDMLEIRMALTKFGYESRIYAQYMDPRMSEHFNLFTDYEGTPDHLILFHASIGGDVFDFVKALPDKKMLIYHNMTPAHFFAGYNDHLANLLSQGPEKVRQFKDHLIFAVGDSDFNRRDLVQLGFCEEKTDTLPIFVDFKKYDLALNKTLANSLRENDVTNILFVGRFSPNKKQDDVIKTFYIYHRYFNPNSRLILMGSYDGMEPYYLRLKQLIEMLGLKSHVILGEQVSFLDLATYYKTADLFLCMSEHEGFLVPVLECFHLGIPLLAYRAGAVPETMGQGGMLFDEKDYEQVAKMMNQIITDAPLREKMLEKQRERLRDFERDKVEKKLQEVIKRVLL